MDFQDIEIYKEARRVITLYERGEWEPQDEHEYAMLPYMYEMYELEKIYFDGNYERPPKLQERYLIDPKDKVVIPDASGKGSSIYYIDRHPAPILNDQTLSYWFEICQFAYDGLFPESGGYNNQTTEFTEYYLIYRTWKKLDEEIRKNEVRNNIIS